MKLLAIALGVLATMTSPADGAPRPAVQHYGNPTLNGQPLPFSEAVRVGDVLYLSGQLGRGPDGKLPEGIEAQTKQTLDNIGATLKLAGLTHADIFHCTAMLADMKLWPDFNKAYVGYFPEGKRPARSAFGTSGLALGALVELECQAYAGK
ncbi:MAG TPA: RidA family protein [Sphingomicrobium sp.]|jgi:enamine deaminase RidA (YjgF/YER057c/UK114 family)|nr:RidA family protein [Sphingomicrobium sp.]